MEDNKKKMYQHQYNVYIKTWNEKTDLYLFYLYKVQIFKNYIYEGFGYKDTDVLLGSSPTIV